MPPQGAMPSWLDEVLRAGPESSVPDVLGALRELLAHSETWMGLLGNCAALLFRVLPGVCWAGFYLTRTPGSLLVLGPFQGPPAVERVGWGQGVIGMAAMDRAAQIAGDVRRVHGHPRPYLDVRAEMAVPLVRDAATLGVLSLLSREADRFGVVEAEMVGAVAALLSEGWPPLQAGPPHRSQPVR